MKMSQPNKKIEKCKVTLQFLSNFYKNETISSGNKSPKKKGKSKRAHVLVAAVERATANFVERGNQVRIDHFIDDNSF